MGKFIKTVLVLVVIAALAFAAWTVVSKDNEVAEQPPAPRTDSSLPSSVDQFIFANPKKSAHYESNAPAHGSILAGVPVNVVIDFNFDLAPPSAISITSGGKEYGTAETTIDQNKLSMRRNLDPQAPDGLYTVSYNACWPDRSCHDGSFQFAVDRKQAASFTDIRGANEVTIRMSGTAFTPNNVRISPGTKVTWINDEGVDHFVNTDSHPAHTYLPGMNSRSLARGSSYSFTFDKVGLYPYHCSAHASTMVGTVLVGS